MSETNNENNNLETQKPPQEVVDSLPTPEKKKRGCLYWVIVALVVVLALAVLANARKDAEAPESSEVDDAEVAVENTSTDTSSTSVLNDSESEEVEVPADSGEEDEELEQLYRSLLGRYQVSYPSGWVLDDAVVAVVGVAIKEEDAAFTNAVEIYSIKDNDNLTLQKAKESYVGGALLLSSANLIDFRVTSESTGTFKGNDAYFVGLTFSDKQTREAATGEMIVWQDLGKNYAIFSKGPSATFAEYDLTLDAIVNSFKAI